MKMVVTVTTWREGFDHFSLEFTYQVESRSSLRKVMAKSDKKDKTTAEKNEAEDIEMAEPEVESVCSLLSPLRSWNSDSEPKSPKKSKKDRSKDDIRTPVEDLSPIANPLAQKKLLKKLHKTIKKGAWDAYSCPCSPNKQILSASKARQVKRGVKEVVKGIRKGDKGCVPRSQASVDVSWVYSKGY